MVINRLGKKLVVRASRAMTDKEAKTIARQVDKLVTTQVEGLAKKPKVSSLTIYLVKNGKTSGSILVYGMKEVKEVAKRCLEAVGKWSQSLGIELTTKLTR